MRSNWLALCALTGFVSGAVVNFEDAGAVPCKKTLFKSCDTSTARAVKNSALFNASLQALAPGDVLLFKQNLIHSGRPNTTDGVRWSMDWRYQDARRQNLNLNPELSSLARSASNPQSAGWSKLD